MSARLYILQSLEEGATRSDRLLKAVSVTPELLPGLFGLSRTPRISLLQPQPTSFSRRLPPDYINSWVLSRGIGDAFSLLSAHSLSCT